MPKRSLNDEERATYEWQMWTPGFGEAGQTALANATVLVSRVGGVGGTAAYYLAAAGIGKLILAHAGNVRANDLNRQILMTHEWLGKPRVESAERRLRELNPRVEIQTVAENITEQNAAKLVGGCDIVLDCAPLFKERFLLNREAVGQKKPMVDSAMFDMEAQVTTIIPGKTPCLSCLVPSEPAAWKRQFPVFGAVSGIVGSIAAIEAIKVISGVGAPLAGRMLICDLNQMKFRTLNLRRNVDCKVCGAL